MKLGLNQFITFYSLLYFGNIFDSPYVKLSIPFFLLVGLLINMGKTAHFRINKLILIAILTLIIGLLRSNHPDQSLLTKFFNSLNFILFILFLRSFLLQLSKSDKPQLVIYKVLIIPYAYLLVFNIIVWLLGIGSEVQDRGAVSVILYNLGFIVDRVQFPFTIGLNSFAVPTAGILSLLIPLECSNNTSLTTFKKTLLLTLFFFCLILIDSRAAIIMPLLAVILSAAFTFLFPRNVFKLFIVVSFFGFLILIGLIVIIVSSEIEVPVLRNSQELLTLNGRLIIWAYSLQDLVNQNLTSLFLGHGIYGHYKTGTSLNWAYIFEQYSGNNFLMHPHNSIISIIFDFGLIGLSLYILLLFYFFNTVNRSPFSRRDVYVFCSYLIYILLISNTETYYGFYYENTLEQFYSIILIISYTKNVSEKTKNVPSNKVSI